MTPVVCVVSTQTIIPDRRYVNGCDQVVVTLQTERGELFAVSISDDVAAILAAQLHYAASAIDGRRTPQEQVARQRQVEQGRGRV